MSYLIKSEDKLNLKAIYAAPFFNEKSTGPEDGREKSYQEIINILKLCNKDISGAEKTQPNRTIIMEGGVQ